MSSTQAASTSTIGVLIGFSAVIPAILIFVYLPTWYILALVLLIIGGIAFGVGISCVRCCSYCGTKKASPQ